MIHPKIKEYLHRYLLAEIAGTALAILASTIAFYLTQNKIAAAFAGTWGENLGFYLAIFFREIYHSHKKHALEKQKYTIRSFAINIRDILLEFGPSEILDSFVIRPAAMYFATTLIANLQIAIFLGKIAADIIFYTLTILAYELKKRHLG